MTSFLGGYSPSKQDPAPRTFRHTGALLSLGGTETPSHLQIKAVRACTHKSIGGAWTSPDGSICGAPRVQSLVELVSKQKGC